MNMKHIGNKLASLRGEKALCDVAGDLGISVSALSMYESGNRIPRDEIKIKLANYYGISVQELFFSI